MKKYGQNFIYECTYARPNYYGYYCIFSVRNRSNLAGIKIVHGQSMIKAENVDHVHDAEHHEGTEGHYHDVAEENEVNGDPSPSPEPEPTSPQTTKTPTESTAVTESSATALPLSILTVLIILAL